MPPEKTFTQAELNGFQAKERKKYQGDLEQLRKDLADRDLIIDAAKARVSELEGQVSSLAGERDTVRAELESATNAHAESVSTLEQQHAEAMGLHRRTLAERTVRQALVAARLVPSAEGVALAEFMRNAQIEQDAAGEVAAVTFGGQRYTQIAEAAKSFIGSHPFFELAPSGGSGAPRTSLAAPFLGKDITKQDPMKLADEGWHTPAK